MSDKLPEHLTNDELDALEAEYSLEGRSRSFPFERDILRLVAEVRYWKAKAS